MSLFNFSKIFSVNTNAWIIYTYKKTRNICIIILPNILLNIG